MVQGQEDMRVRIQNEFRWETAGEGVDFYEELRWKTWKESKFNNADGTAGMKDVWGLSPILTHGEETNIMYGQSQNTKLI